MFLMIKFYFLIEFCKFSIHYLRIEMQDLKVKYHDLFTGQA